jgi:rare lipoprotein A
VGAFTQHDNALSLRDRLEREALRPISIQTTGADTARVYRVRIGPLASAEEGDRLAERVAQLGITGARVVAE